jgi:hypothetical protein
MLAALLAAPVSGAARTGALSVRLEASVGESRPLGPGAIRWVVDGTALYGGLLEGQKSSLTLYLTSAEPVAAYSLIAGWPTKLDIGGLEREETFVCGIVAIELGGPCFAVGPVAAIGSARIVEHDLRVGGRLVWELVFPRAVCLPCASL